MTERVPKLAADIGETPQEQLNWLLDHVIYADLSDPKLLAMSYVRDGHVEALFAQDCYGWGYQSVKILLDKIVNNQNPPQERVIDPLTPVSKENAEEFGKKWEKWLGK